MYSSCHNVGEGRISEPQAQTNLGADFTSEADEKKEQYKASYLDSGYNSPSSAAIEQE